MLRLAEEKDYWDVVRMARAFHSASPYSNLSFDEVRCEEIFSAYLRGDRKSLIIILAEKDSRIFGMLIGACANLPFSNDRVASELAWWIDEDARGSRDSIMLMKAYEDWSIRVGAKVTQMAMLDQSTDLERFYLKQGYRPAERSFIK